MDIGSRLRALRLSRGLTQSDIAQPLYTGAYVSTIEAGRRQPSEAALAHFARKLRVDLEQLRTGRPPGLIPQLELQLQEARRLASGGRFDEAEDLCGRVGKLAQTYGLERHAAYAEECRALCDERRGELEAAIEHAEAALQRLKDEPPTARAPVIARLARCLHMRGETRYALFLLESALEALEREDLRDPVALLTIYGPLVHVRFDAGLYKQASEVAKQALLLVDRTQDPTVIATMYVNVARVQLHKEQYADAEASLSRATALFREAELRTEIGVAHLAHGYVLARKGNGAAARAHFEKARLIFEDTRNPINEAHTCNELARLARQAGEDDEARRLLERAIQVVGDESDIRVLAWAHRELGLCLARDDGAVAEKHIRRAIDLYERAEERLELVASYGYLGDVYREHGNEAGACEAYRTGIESIRRFV